MMRCCLVTLMLAPAPPNALPARLRTSTNTSVPSRCASPGQSRHRRARASDNCAPPVAGQPPADGPEPGPPTHCRVRAWWRQGQPGQSPPPVFSFQGISLSASFASAQGAAREAAAAQHYPEGALYVVATPIGNLADITLRALHVLQMADTVACEDTRHTQSMLRAYGIDKGAAQLLAVHQHNEAEAAQNVVQRLQLGQRVVYVSDAGTPGVSDPGARLVAAVQAAGLRAVPLPGASSITTALSVAGAVAHSTEHGGFVFAGFLPVKNAERATVIAQQLAPALAVLGDRPVTLARELTKQFEEVTTRPARELTAWLDGAPQRSRGEFVVLLHPVAVASDDGASLRVLRLLVQELPLKTAVRLAAEITGASRNVLYDTALAWKRSGADDEGEAGDAGD